jgi:hypothetical protein
MHLSLLALDDQKPAEQWGHELEWLSLMFFYGNTGTEKLPEFPACIEIDLQRRFTVFDVRFPFPAIPEKRHSVKYE